MFTAQLPRSRLLLAALGLGGAAAVLLLAAPLGTRAGLWHFGFGFRVLRWSVYLAGAGFLVTLVALAALASTRPRLPGSRPAVTAFAALLLALGVAAPSLSQWHKARSLPPINDITTNPADPPEFTRAGSGVAGGAAGAPYPGVEFADAQRAAYGDLATLRVGRSAHAVFRAALDTARASRGWTVVTAEARAGHIEATARTPWFGFEDDVAIRVRRVGEMSEVDVRSRSRVGTSDVGANAERIRSYRRRLAERLGGAVR
ncbi:MAG: DUF1499 domain-containing protein [Gemmatimonadetes bacterium]|nr:DUF1499 domain-containing protein [Gemmatimonadota bacterium]